MKKWVAIHNSKTGECVFKGEYCCTCYGGFVRRNLLLERLSGYQDIVIFDLVSGTKTYESMDDFDSDSDDLTVPLLKTDNGSLCVCDPAEIAFASYYNTNPDLEEFTQLVTLQLKLTSKINLALPDTLKHVDLEEMFKINVSGNFQLETLSMHDCDFFLKNPFSMDQTRFLKALDIQACPKLIMETQYMKDLEVLILINSDKVTFSLDPLKIKSLCVDSLTNSMLLDFLKGNQVIRSLNLDIYIDYEMQNLLGACTNLRELAARDFRVRPVLSHPVSILNQLKRLTLSGDYASVPWGSCNRLEEISVHNFSGLSRPTCMKKVHVQSELDETHIRFLQNAREIYCSGDFKDLKIDLPCLLNTNNASLAPIVDRNWTRIYAQRHIMVILLMFRPKDVTRSIAKEIKNSE